MQKNNVFDTEACPSSIEIILRGGFQFGSYKSCIKYLFGEGYLQCIDSATAALVGNYSLLIQTLTYSQAIAPLTADQPVPQGCAVAISSDRCTVNLMLKVTNCSCFSTQNLSVVCRE